MVLLCPHFQRFCRDLYSESVDHLIHQPAYASLVPVLRSSLVAGPKLSTGNADPGNIGADFSRLGIDFWDQVRKRDRRNRSRQHRLDELNRWRNAVAHQDFTSPLIGGREGIRIAEVRAWRSVCECLALEFDRVMGVYLRSITGVSPW